MKTSEKIGIAIVAILAVILVSTLLAGGNNDKKIKDFCDGLCQPYDSKTWFFMGEPISGNDDNNFPTKEECVSACLLKKL